MTMTTIPVNVKEIVLHKLEDLMLQVGQKIPYVKELV
jgi:hypothetical protein